jgi:hypothetical protein
LQRIIQLAILTPGLPTNNKRPVKEKTYQEQTLALWIIPLELDDYNL